MIRVWLRHEVYIHLRGGKLKGGAGCFDILDDRVLNVDADAKFLARNGAADPK